MLNLDQVRLLENRVEKAVTRIHDLVTENNQLRGQLSGFQSRIGELEGLVRAFKDDQGRIEEGILNALDRLSAFEDNLYTQPIHVDTTTDFDTTIVEQIKPVSISQPEESGDSGIQIAADWQESEESKPAPSSVSDGQMDIF